MLKMHILFIHTLYIILVFIYFFTAIMLLLNQENERRKQRQFTVRDAVAASLLETSVSVNVV